MTENSKILIALLNETTIIKTKPAVKYWLVVARSQVVCEDLRDSLLCQLALQALKDCFQTKDLYKPKMKPT